MIRHLLVAGATAMSLVGAGAHVASREPVRAAVTCRVWVRPVVRVGPVVHVDCVRAGRVVYFRRWPVGR